MKVMPHIDWKSFALGAVSIIVLGTVLAKVRR